MATADTALVRPPQGAGISKAISLASRWVRLIAGLGLFAGGLALMVRAGLGLSPWDVLHDGLRGLTPLSFGQVVVAVSLVVLGFGWMLGVRPGAGTVANSVLVGVFADALLQTGLLSELDSGAAPLRIGATLTGVAAIALGSAVYIGANLGAGPRDGLMLGMGRVLHRSPGTARALIEAVVFVVGVALGGSIGWGTLAYLLAIGPAIDLAFRLVRPETGNAG